MRPLTLTLVTLKVRNLARSRAFYEALGFGEASTPTEDVAFYQAGQVVIGLWEHDDHVPGPGIELAHNLRSPKEVDEVLEIAARAGGTVPRPAAIASWGGYGGAFADPDGYIWEVEHNPAWTLTDDGGALLQDPER